MDFDRKVFYTESGTTGFLALNDTENNDRPLLETLYFSVLATGILHIDF